MNTNHWLLLTLWIGYCAVHSFFADINIKNRIEKFTGKGFKYYRPVYAIFAAVTLGLLLWYQYSIESISLLSDTILFDIPGIVLSAVGFSIMLICIKKYFYELSGLQALQQGNVKNTLQQKGLHKFVRHPLYLGTLLFIWGLFFIFPLLSNLIAAVIITLYVLIGISLEEKKLYLEYGESYAMYASKVPRLIPHFYKIIKAPFKGSL